VYLFIYSFLNLIGLNYDSSFLGCLLVYVTGLIFDLAM